MKTHLTYEFVQSLIFSEDIEKLELVFTKVSNVDVNYADKTGYSLLCFAIHYGKIKSVEFLLAKGADINQKNKVFHDEAPLHLAVRDFNVEIIKLLLQAGVDINVKNDQSQTALLLACEHENVDLQMFIDAGADVFVKDIHEKIALHYAAQSGSVNAIKDLITLGLDVNAKDLAQSTP